MIIMAKNDVTIEDWLTKIDLSKAVLWNKMGLPKSLHKLPWLFPSILCHPRAEDINKILRKSLQIQSSTIPNNINHSMCRSLNNVIASSGCLLISGFLAKYLTWIGITGVNVVYGFRKLTDSDAPLNINGALIDNTYYFFNDEDFGDLEKFEQVIKVKCYNFTKGNISDKSFGKK